MVHKRHLSHLLNLEALNLQFYFILLLHFECKAVFYITRLTLTKHFQPATAVLDQLKQIFKIFIRKPAQRCDHSFFFELCASSVTSQSMSSSIFVGDQCVCSQNLYDSVLRTLTFSELFIKSGHIAGTGSCYNSLNPKYHVCYSFTSK